MTKKRTNSDPHAVKAYMQRKKHQKITRTLKKQLKAAETPEEKRDIRNKLIKNELDSFVYEGKMASWDDIHFIAESCKTSLLELGTGVISLTNGITAMGKNYFDDFIGFSKSLSILSKDMDHISNQIVAIEEPIKDKKGVIISADELMACYAKYQEFLKLNETINTIMVPTLCDLSDAFQTAYDRFMADQTPEDKEQAEKELNIELKTINKEGA